VLEVVSLDRPGLLARIGEVFVEYGVICRRRRSRPWESASRTSFSSPIRSTADHGRSARQALIQAAIRDKLDAREAA
jgi:[protein-PII] uridylyltransferase